MVQPITVLISNFNHFRANSDGERERNRWCVCERERERERRMEGETVQSQSDRGMERCRRERLRLWTKIDPAKKRLPNLEENKVEVFVCACVCVC